LLPLFFSGRLAELPPDPAHAPLSLLRFLARELKPEARIKVVWWGRVPESSDKPDEVRLLVRPYNALDGFQGIEVGLEYQQGVADFIATPYVMLRVREESASYFALPRSVVWTRGRKPEERVSIIRPKLPTRQLCLALVQRLVSFVEQSAAAPHQPALPDSGLPMRAPISGGRGSKISKPATARLPLHAT